MTKPNYTDTCNSEVRALGRELGVDEDQVMRHVSAINDLK